MQNLIAEAGDILKKSNHTVVFTGAGISVESGIPPFRGEDGLWNKYNPEFIEISYFYSYPIESWKLIKEIFYDFFGEAKPNRAHVVIAELEKMGIVKSVITQNIDNLHQAAGSKTVFEFHGSSEKLLCTGCGTYFPKSIVEEQEVPLCSSCHELLKPDFVFFGEQIPEPAGSKSLSEGMKSDVILIIGTSGEVMPACNIPYYAKQNGAKIIEVNPQPSNYTERITDIFLQGKATVVMDSLLNYISGK